MINNALDSLTKISDYATAHMVSTAGVYKRLKSNRSKEALEGHLIKVNGITYLDDYAVEYLETGGNGNSVVVSNYSKELEEKSSEINQLKDKIIILMEEQRTLNNSVFELQKIAIEREKEKAELLLLQEKNSSNIAEIDELQASNNKKDIEIEELKEQLDIEKNRKLSFKERLFGKK